MKDYYKVLNIQPDATLEEIKSAFNLLSKKNHPDKGGASEKFREIYEAYYVLRDENRRKIYDKERNGGDPEFLMVLDGFDEEFTQENAHLFQNLVVEVFNMLDGFRKFKNTTLIGWNDFYVIGEAILVKHFHINFFSKTDKPQLRTDINDTEILGAFPKSGNVILFLRESDAIDYALETVKKLNIYKSASYKMPPIFKVNYNGDKRELVSTYLPISFKQNYKVKTYNSFTNARCCKADASKLTLISAELKISFLDIQKSYPRVDVVPQVERGDHKPQVTFDIKK